MIEEWRDVPGYVGAYQISNLGNVRSLDRIITQMHNSGQMIQRTVKGNMLKPDITNGGYLAVYFWQNMRKKKWFVHRLVATAFLGDHKESDVVNHKDYNRQNNAASNLEWISQKENVNYSKEHMRVSRLRKKVDA